jgi:hypothetical protein
MSSLYFAAMKDIISDEVDMISKFSSLTIKDYNDMDIHIQTLTKDNINALLALTNNNTATEAVMNNDVRTFNEFFKLIESSLPELMDSEILSKFRIYFFLGLYQTKKPGTKNTRRDIDDILEEEYGKNVDNLIMYKRAVRSGLFKHLKDNYTKPINTDKVVDVYQNVHESFVKMMTNKFRYVEPGSTNLVQFMQEYWNSKVTLKASPAPTETLDLTDPTVTKSDISIGTTDNDKVEKDGAIMSNNIDAKAMIVEIANKVSPILIDKLHPIISAFTPLAVELLSADKLASNLDYMKPEEAAAMINFDGNEKMLADVRKLLEAVDVSELRKELTALIDTAKAVVPIPNIDSIESFVASPKLTIAHMALSYPEVKSALLEILDILAIYSDKIKDGSILVEVDKLKKIEEENATEISKLEKEAEELKAKIEAAKKKAEDDAKAGQVALQTTLAAMGHKDRTEPALRAHLKDILKNDFIRRQFHNLEVFYKPGCTFESIVKLVDADSTDPENKTQKGLKQVKELAKEYLTDELRIITLIRWINDPGTEKHETGKVA